MLNCEQSSSSSASSRQDAKIMAKEFPAASVERKEPVAQKSAQSLRKPKNSKISAELRQAVKDLGGDDEDLDLIDGVDEDEEVPQVSSKVKGNLSDEVCPDWLLLLF